MKKLSFLLFSFLLVVSVQKGDAGPERLPPAIYPGYERPSCLSQPPVNEKSEAYKKGVEQAQVALQKPYTSAESVWNQEALAKKSYLREAIRAFLEGKRGQSVRKIKLSGKKPDELHKELIAAGFYYERVPLPAQSNDKGRKFWRRDGTKTTNSHDPQVIPMDIYAHPDGGIIRVKPEGIPSPRHPRPEPSASKAVVYNLKPREDQAEGKKHLDTRYRNEAFKVSDEGLPLPKGVSPKVGMRFPIDRTEIAKMKDPDAAKAELKGWIETVMNAAHIDLAADFSHCPKEKTSTGESRTSPKT